MYGAAAVACPPLCSVQFPPTTPKPPEEQARTAIPSQTWRSLDVWFDFDGGIQRSSTMSTTHRDKSGGKPRQRSRKTDQRGQKPEGQQDPKPGQRDEDQIDPVVASADAPANATAAPADVPLPGELEPANAGSIGATVPADSHPIDMQTIANAYRDYTRKSLQESRFLVEKLIGVRSFDRAMEVQTEFARQAYADFVAQSQRIFALYGELARQTLRPWQGFAAEANQAGDRPGSAA
jgi:hypothetical protein